ncbi:MAG TPA: hypothetical protein VKR55_04115 [Bradyrhizobium sp.]|uniref:hypothetical protein n=1 Tax=Bradyrhizobium sp. TaxID=376 RepID=UPI002C2A0E38|nr:hypothetical protein [Bradyrhizobium sp.]HLZ01320.1 hypothetical protein [Bradyrhizobium sp.]
MSSFISNSDRYPASDWSRCLTAGVRAFLIGVFLLSALIFAVDPYDSGRFGLLGITGVDDKLPYTANASRARDGRFDSAIFGDSTGQLIRPAELSPATAKHFVQLVAPGATPRGHLAILDFFLRHHAHVGALVVVIDDPWCASSAAPSADDRFPYWLYGDSTLTYARHLFSWSALDRVFQRIAIGLGQRKRFAEDGFWSYEEVWPPGSRQPSDAPRPPGPRLTGTVDTVFPYKDRLASVIRRLPSEVALVLVVPPVFHTFLPTPGSQDAAAREACNAAYRIIVAGRPHSNLINYRIDNALTRDPKNFADLIHYRADIASKVDEGIIASVRQGNAAKIDF